LIPEISHSTFPKQLSRARERYVHLKVLRVNA
jgi:hypothetical protein